MTDHETGIPGAPGERTPLLSSGQHRQQPGTATTTTTQLREMKAESLKERAVAATAAVGCE